MIVFMRVKGLDVGTMTVFVLSLDSNIMMCKL